MWKMKGGRIQKKPRSVIINLHLQKPTAPSKDYIVRKNRWVQRKTRQKVEALFKPTTSCFLQRYSYAFLVPSSDQQRQVLWAPIYSAVFSPLWSFAVLTATIFSHSVTIFFLSCMRCFIDKLFETAYTYFYPNNFSGIFSPDAYPIHFQLPLFFFKNYNYEHIFFSV